MARPRRGVRGPDAARRLPGIGGLRRGAGDDMVRDCSSGGAAVPLLPWPALMLVRTGASDQQV